MSAQSCKTVQAGWDALTARSALLARLSAPRPDLQGYLLSGPESGGEPIRLGFFAGIHGDEPEGVKALLTFAEEIGGAPELALGYQLYLYPLCNPTGYERGTRGAASGKDLNREFWQDSLEPEVVWLENELRARNFDGLISLHTDDTSDGFYGYAHGATITENLILPALTAAGTSLPINDGAMIDGFPASQGIIRDSFPGILRAAPEAHPRPFEIILETPQRAAEQLKEAALVAALRSILVEYRVMLAYAAGL